MVKEVEPTKALLKEYKDGELVHYAVKKLRSILMTAGAEGESNEALLAQKFEAIGGIVFPILIAVDKRMNDLDGGPSVVL